MYWEVRAAYHASDAMQRTPLPDLIRFISLSFGAKYAKEAPNKGGQQP